MYLAQFKASEDPHVAAPTALDVALVGTHDTPTFAQWLTAGDVEERVRYGLLAEQAVPQVRKERRRATRRLAKRLGRRVDDPRALLAELLEWLGRSASPLVVPWLEDLWLEDVRVNLPGTRSSERANWQRPMRKLLDEIFADPEVDGLIRRLHRARSAESPE
jgi:4-alpha-glucanotransferase